MTSPSAIPTQIATYVALFGATVLGIHLIDGPWKTWNRTYQGQPLDPWWLTHLFWGWLGARMGQSLTQQMALACSNELIEAWARKHRPDLTWGGQETPANVIMDVVGNALGWWAGRT